MVAMCLPSGTGNWAASAGINHYRSQYNDEWCLSLSGTMHEIGHNLGLHHSNTQGEAYQDYSGYMAAGYKDANWPRKAFNGHKNWLLGWYSSRHLSLRQQQKYMRHADSVRNTRSYSRGSSMGLHQSTAAERFIGSKVFFRSR